MFYLNLLHSKQPDIWVINKLVNSGLLWCNHQQCRKLTDSTQGDVAQDNNEKDNAANHISALPAN